MTAPDTSEILYAGYFPKINFFPPPLNPQISGRVFRGANTATVRVNSLEWDVMGGCKNANATVFSDDEKTLWDYVDYLGFESIVTDDRGNEIWWGFVFSVTVRVGKIEVTFSLDDVSNAVKVAYSETTANQYTSIFNTQTSWYEDSDSIARYGRKELIETAQATSSDVANARASSLLAKTKKPMGILNIGNSESSASATIVMKGWYETLRWRYAKIDPVQGIGYQEATGAATQSFGNAASSSMVFQSFQSDKSYRVKSVYVRASKTGAPTDNFTVAIYEAGAGGVPVGSSLGGTGTQAGTGMGTGFGTYYIPLSGSANLEANKLYCLRISRSGANDAANYYNVEVNTNLGFTSGVFKIWNGSVWNLRSPDADLHFSLFIDAFVPTTHSVLQIVRNFADFISSVTISDASGVSAFSWRKGDKTALAELEDFLKSGTVSGQNYMVSIDRKRRMDIKAEPSSSTFIYVLDQKGNIINKSMERNTNKGTFSPIYGVWVGVVDLVPKNINLNNVLNPDRYFIVGSKWTYNEGVSYRFRGNLNPDILSSVRT